MSTALQPHLLVLVAPLLASIRRILMKWQTQLDGEQLSQPGSSPMLLLHFLPGPLVIPAFFVAFLSGISWILAISMLDS